MIQEHKLTEADVDALSDAAIGAYYLRPWKRVKSQESGRPPLVDRIDKMLASGMTREQVKAAIQSERDAAKAKADAARDERNAKRKSRVKHG